METKEDVITTLASNLGASVPVRTTDNQGYNESFSVARIEDVLDTVETSEFIGCSNASDDNIDLDVWTQEYVDEKNIEALREDLDAGRLYKVSFYSEEEGCEGYMDILIWQ